MAGAKGASFATLSVAEKIAISKRVEKKKALIQKLAKKLLPSVRKAEVVRLQHLRTATEDVDLNDLYNIVDISFDLLESKQQGALKKKGTKSGIDIDVLFEVYTRGLEDYPKGSDKTSEQYAFERVNAFIMNKNIDSDIG